MTRPKILQGALIGIETVSNDVGIRVLCAVCNENRFINERGEYFVCADGWHVCSTACQRAHDGAARMTKELGGKKARELARTLRYYRPQGFARGFDWK